MNIWKGKKRNFLRVGKFNFRLVFSPVSSKGRVYLLQGRVRDPEAAEAHVSERLLQLPEQAGVRSVLEASAGEQVGHLLTDGIDQPGLGDVVVDQPADAVHVACKEEPEKSLLKEATPSRNSSNKEEER